MCGIAGIMDMQGAREIDRGALARMADALIHRGPDGAGSFVEPGIGLAHRRLAVIDLAGGAQPFTSRSGRTVLNYNGEIYNFAALRRDLEHAGAVFNTACDTEVLAELWDRHGADAIGTLNGMFAFGIWQPEAATLTLVRDRLGEKPLYYAQTDAHFLVFASEIGALIASGLLATEIDPAAVREYFAYGYVPDPLTIYRGVFKLPPASTLTLRRGSTGMPTPARYWHPPGEAGTYASFDEACTDLLALLDSAVQQQMVADVPLGAFLSGGVDSSAIVASMSLQSGAAVKTTTIGFTEATHDERSHARQVATLFSTDHREQVLGLEAMSLIPRIAATYGEPFADSSALPTFLVCQATREKVTVALSGDGGDELFAGYRRYPFFLREESIRARLPHQLRTPLFSLLGRAYPAFSTLPRPLRLKSTFRSLAENTAESYFRAVSINRQEDVAGMLSGDMPMHDPQARIASLFDEAGTGDPLRAAQYADLMTWLPGRMLVKIDRASMAHSLEVRPPLLNHELVEWAMRLPASFKLQGDNGKRIFKEAHHARLPRDILYRRKRGFDLPVARWLRAGRGNPLETLNATTHWRDCGMLNSAAIERMAAAHRAGRHDYGQELWSVIMFNAFLAQR